MKFQGKQTNLSKNVNISESYLMRWLEWMWKSARVHRTLALLRPRPALTATSFGQVIFRAAPIDNGNHSAIGSLRSDLRSVDRTDVARRIDHYRRYIDFLQPWTPLYTPFPRRLHCVASLALSLPGTLSVFASTLCHSFIHSNL